MVLPSMRHKFASSRDAAAADSAQSVFDDELNRICPCPLTSRICAGIFLLDSRNASSAIANKPSAITQRASTGRSPTNPHRMVSPTPALPAAAAASNNRNRRDGNTTTDTAIDIRELSKRAAWDTAATVVGPQITTWRQILPKTMVPLVPPKPNEFFTAILISMSRARLAQ